MVGGIVLSMAWMRVMSRVFFLALNFFWMALMAYKLSETMLTGMGSEMMWVAIQRIAFPRADSSPVLLDLWVAPRKDGSDLERMTGPLCE